ncbi:MAG: PA2779 family protein [Planctomycetota bacterium]|nr:PA2779 family protein [Planctomycetota bacterium]
MLKRGICAVLVTMATMSMVLFTPESVQSARAEMVDSSAQQGSADQVRTIRDKEIVRATLTVTGMPMEQIERTVDRLQPQELQMFAAMPEQLRTAGMYEFAPVVAVVLVVLLILYIVSREEDPMEKEFETPKEVRQREMTAPRTK